MDELTLEDTVLLDLYTKPPPTSASKTDEGRQHHASIVKPKRGTRSVEAKKRRRKVYRSKIKAMKRDKYYDKLCEEGLKKRYRSIPVEDRLPVGVLEPDQTELLSDQDVVSSPLSSNKECNAIDRRQDSLGCPHSSNKECDGIDERQDVLSSPPSSNNECDGIDASGHDDMSSLLSSNKECDYVDEYHGYSFNAFDPILIPTEESLPSAADLSDTMYIDKSNNEVIKARRERNNALLLAKHYRDVAEKCKLKTKILQIEMERTIIDTKEQAAIGIDRVKKFWRNQVMEGDSRAGKILRSALLCKNIEK